MTPCALHFAQHLAQHKAQHPALGTRHGTRHRGTQHPAPVRPVLSHLQPLSSLARESCPQ